MPIYAVGAFVGFLVLFAVYVCFLTAFVQLGQDWRVYYLVLIPMGLCASIVLVGIFLMRASRAVGLL